MKWDLAIVALIVLAVAAVVLFPKLAQLHADGLVVGNDTFFYVRREQIVEMASRHAIPTIYGWRAA